MTLLEAISPTSRKLLKPNPREKFDSVIKELWPAISMQQMAMDVLPTDEDKFIALYIRGATVASHCASIARGGRNPSSLFHDLQTALQSLTVFGLIWLRQQAEDDGEVCNVVWRERERQIELRQANPKKYPFAMEHHLPDVRRKFRVLGEEIGEVGDAIDKLECAIDSPRQRAHAHCHRDEEIIQVTACGAAWLESFVVVTGGAR